MFSMRMRIDSTERIERKCGRGVAVAFAASALLAGALLPFGAFAEFKVDRSAMSDAYWKIWDDFCPRAEKVALEAASGIRPPGHLWRLPMGAPEPDRDGYSAATAFRREMILFIR